MNLANAFQRFRILPGASAALLSMASLVFSAHVFAVNIAVKQSDGKPAEGVIVTLSNASTKASQGGVQEMGQRKRQFDPHILVVQKGATVSFPNYDDIKHHVYSFSSVKRFEQELYKGRESKAVTFDKAGVVELGCNVHDWMLGYIYITDTPYFGKTDASGILTLPDAPDGNYDITVWHPRMDNDSNSLTLNADISGTFNIALKDEIEEEQSSDFEFDFDDY